MSSQAWRSEALRIHELVVKKWPVYGDEDRRFLTLALAGEVGELCNLIKKAWRGDPDQGARADAVVDELADIRIYLEVLARACGVDLDAAAAAKVKKLYDRWPETRPTS